MTKHLNAEEQTAIIWGNLKDLTSSDPDRWAASARRIGDTATSHQTGFALALSLATVIALFLKRITELGQQPVTDLASDGMNATIYAARLVGTVIRELDQDAGDAAYEVFTEIEDAAALDNGETLARVYFEMCRMIQQLAAQCEQAIKDSEATA